MKTFKTFVGLSLVTTFMAHMPLMAQTYTRTTDNKQLTVTAQNWMKKGEWRNGFTANPHNTVNAVEFYEQYQKNPAQWKAMFKWLGTHDLLNIKAGRYRIPGTAMSVSVEDGKNDNTHKGSESHYKHIDMQFAVKGTEGFYILDHESSRMNCLYKPDAMHYDYDEKKVKSIESNPNEFFLFFPDDWHVAKVPTQKADQNIRVLVVKIDYID